MKPGKQLDQLIAEKVMGGKRHQEHSVLAIDISAKSYTIGEGWEYPRYSTDISAAWEVFDKLRSINKGCFFIEWDRISEMWSAGFNGNTGKIEIEADSAPYAICLAALKAIE